MDLGTLRSADTVTFTFDAPQIVMVTPTRIGDEGGVLTIVGHSFGTRGAVLFRGLTDAQDALAIIETTPASEVNETQLLIDTVDSSTVLDGVIWAALPRCAPILLYTHNRIECWVLPNRVPEVSWGAARGWRLGAWR